MTGLPDGQRSGGGLSSRLPCADVPLPWSGSTTRVSSSATSTWDPSLEALLPRRNRVCMLATCSCNRPRRPHSLASCFSSKELNGSQLHYIVSMLKTNPAWIRSQGDSLALEVARRRPETNPFISSARFAVDVKQGVGWVRRRRSGTAQDPKRSDQVVSGFRGFFSRRIF